MTETTTPAAWYPDPATPGLMRYWDGAQWTEHTAPVAPPQPAPRRRMPTGAIVALVAGGVLVLLLGLGVLAAIAIPVYLNQRDKAMDAAAQADVIGVATEVYYAWVDYPEVGPSIVAESDSVYVIEVYGESYSTHPRNVDTHLDEYVTDGWDYCVSVESGSGTTFSYLYSTDEISEGGCPALG